MTAMMLWISQHTGYTIPELPTIVELSPFDLKRFAYGCDETPIPNGNDDICSVQEYWDLDEWGKEKEAYKLQDEWLQEKYNVSVYEVIDINELFLMIITACHDSMWGIPDPAYQNQNQKFDSAQ